MKRQSAARLLLSVFLLMMVCALHIHTIGDFSSNDCTACVNHIPHTAHLSSGGSHIGECPLCQITTFSYLKPAEVVVTSSTSSVCVDENVVSCGPYDFYKICISLRAPPCSSVTW